MREGFAILSAWTIRLLLHSCTGRCSSNRWTAWQSPSYSNQQWVGALLRCVRHLDKRSWSSAFADYERLRKRASEHKLQAKLDNTCVARTHHLAKVYGIEYEVRADLVKIGVIQNIGALDAKLRVYAFTNPGVLEQ